MPSPKQSVAKVLISVKTDHPLLVIARADAGSAMLPFACREIVEGNVSDAVIPVTEWAKLQAFIRTLPGGKEALPFAISDAPEPEKPEASPRAIAARKVAEIVTLLGAVSPVGGDVLREETGRYYAVPFGYGMLMSGVIMVYSHQFVRVCYTADTGDAPPVGLPRQDSRVFDTIEAAAKFLTLCLHQKKYAEALLIPQRPQREKKKS
jgi:hypothetical protein